MTRNPTVKNVSLTGTWRLISFEVDNATGLASRPFGPDPHGLLIYTSTGHFSVMVLRKDRPRFADPDQVRGTREEVSASFNGCISYYGKYRVNADEGFVVHQVQGSLFPNWEDSEQTRYFTLSANRLHLSTPPTQWNNGKAIAKLVWQKAS